MKTDISNPATHCGLSINTLLVLSFVVVSLVPISILGFKVYNAAWENAWREVQEKNQSLAKNLAAPLSGYIDDRHIALSLIAEQLAQPENLGDKIKTSAILAQGLTRLNRFQAMFLLGPEHRIINYASNYTIDIRQTPRLTLPDSHFFETAFRTDNILLSPVVLNPLSGKTAIFIALPVTPDAGGNPTQLLVGEFKIDVIEAMRAGIHFGQHGHSAIVDPAGHVIAHPNPDWMRDDIKDLSDLSIVQAMMNGGTGVTEFYSPFKKQDMVAGFTALPKYGWGIMVPQPKIEVSAQVDRVLRAELAWALAGLSIALIVGFSLANWITRPINQLAQAGRGLQEKNYQYRLPDTRCYTPREIQQLGQAFGGAVTSLINSREALDTLNQSLQQRIDEATAELRDTNRKLEKLAKVDHLTQLANRRHFENTMLQLASRRQSDSQTVCLLLLDVDGFKAINDKYGHPAGDAVLIQIGNILQQSLRNTDIAARYAGDEFVVLLRADLKASRLRASQLRKTIDEHHFVYNGKDLHATVSIGLISCDISTECSSIEELLRHVDDAMYKAKRLGRNCVAEISPTQKP